MPAFADSMLLTKEMNTQLLEWYGDSESKWSLAYRASRDGFSSQAFHECCDGRGENIIVILANDYVFGGYSPLSWTSNGEWLSSGGRSWLFSLTNPSNVPARFPTKGSRQGEMYGDARYGPIYGAGNDIRVISNCHQTEGSYTKLGHSYDTSRCDAAQNHNFLCGRKSFLVTDYEVFVRARAE